MISGEHSRINGLVLAGGKSTRMGTDKGLTNWHGEAQRYHMAGMLKSLCTNVYISCRDDQAAEILRDGYQPLTDAPAYAGSGPTGGILTAMELAPASSWLVVACDLPLLDRGTLEYLLAHRDPNAIATTFESPFDGLPEPLITVWEPAAYTILLHKLQEGYKCPRKVLINNPAKLLKPQNPDALMNANTPEDAEKVKALTGL